MYELKDIEKVAIINQTELAKKVGINQATLNRIFNKKQKCSKVMAYAISKCISENDEIEDYFKYVKKGE